MTSGGSPYSRFRRALKTGNPTIIRAAAAEPDFLGLPDALEVCVALATTTQDRYEQSAVEWLARLCLEQRPSLGELGRAVAALSVLPLQGEESLDALREIATPHPHRPDGTSS